MRNPIATILAFISLFFAIGVFMSQNPQAAMPNYQMVDFVIYKLDDWTYVKEFTPLADKNKICVLVSSGDGGGVSCFDKQ